MPSLACLKDDCIARPLPPCLADVTTKDMLTGESVAISLWPELGTVYLCLEDDKKLSACRIYIGGGTALLQSAAVTVCAAAKLGNCVVRSTQVEVVSRQAGGIATAPDFHTATQ